MFWMRNKENSFPIHTLIWWPDICVESFSKHASTAIKLGIMLYISPEHSPVHVVGNPNRKKMHIFGFVGIFEYIC